MLKKTALVFGLAMVAGTGLAAQGSSAMQPSGGMSQGQPSGGMSQGQPSGGMSQGAMRAKFRSLDDNGDGRLSFSEAQADPQVAELYDSLDTDSTITSDPQYKGNASQGNGISFEQFQAGMQAKRSGSGAVGPAVSGGQTYTLMKDGSKRLSNGGSGMQQSSGGMRNRMNNNRRSMNNGMGNGDSMSRGMNGERSMDHATKHNGSGSMRNRGSSGASGDRTGNDANY